MTATPSLESLATPFLERAHVPYSGRPGAAIALLADGRWVPGVRVENASFSLSLDAAVNAVTSAVAAGRPDIVALFASGRVEDPVPYLGGVLGGRWTRRDGIVLKEGTALPDAGDPLDLLIPFEGDHPMPAVRALASRAVVGESRFPVSCAVDLGDGVGIPGVNVEHGRWSDILCAERNAFGSWVTLGRPAPERLYLSCVKDPTGAPCGACRQWLVEFAPDLPVVMDRGHGSTDVVTASSLLPGAFTGRSIRPAQDPDGGGGS